MTAPVDAEAVARLLDLYREADPRRAYATASDRQTLVVARLLDLYGDDVQAVTDLLPVGDKRVYQRRKTAKAICADGARLARALTAGEPI